MIISQKKQKVKFKKINFNKKFPKILILFLSVKIVKLIQHMKHKKVLNQTSLNNKEKFIYLEIKKLKLKF